MHKKVISLYSIIILIFLIFTVLTFSKNMVLENRINVLDYRIDVLNNQFKIFEDIVPNDSIITVTENFTIIIEEGGNIIKLRTFLEDTSEIVIRFDYLSNRGYYIDRIFYNYDGNIVLIQDIDDETQYPDNWFDLVYQIINENKYYDTVDIQTINEINQKYNSD